MIIEEILTDMVDCPNVRFLQVEGLKATQSREVLKLLEKLKIEDFDLIIEIGTQEGGFSLLLKEYLKNEVHTWDISQWYPIDLKRDLFNKHGINYHIRDCFQDSLLVKLIKDDRKKIVFCDGGNKGIEFDFFSKYLNKGDFIGAHDYFETHSKRDNNIWTTCELVYSGIEGAINREGLTQQYREDSLNAVWALYKK